jgi:hypothetical protein
MPQFTTSTGAILLLSLGLLAGTAAVGSEASCDTEFSLGPTGIVARCAKDPVGGCQQCGVANGTCKLQPAPPWVLVPGFSAQTCACIGPQQPPWNGSGPALDTCFAVAFLDGQGNRQFKCFNNPDCNCRDAWWQGFPQPHCIDMGLPPAIGGWWLMCQCANGHEREPNPE